MEEISHLRGKVNHKKWRALIKKQKRKLKRQAAAKSTKVDEKEPSEEEFSTDEETRLKEERKREQEEKLWLERERRAQVEWQQKQEWAAKEKIRKEQEEQRIREEWEEQQRKEKEEQELREKEAEEKRKKQDDLLKEATKNQKQDGEDWHNPLAPPMRPGIERDECPFYQRVGACRYRERCSRAHVGVDQSSTILFAGMYTHFELDQGLRDDLNADVGLEYEEGETYDAYVDFYDDVFPEFRSCGRILQFKVCCNYEPHLRGNVYVQYEREEDAISAFAKFNGRWFGGRQLTCEFTHVTNWKQAVCGLFFRKKCPKGKNCNFMHVFRNPGNAFWSLEPESERHSVSRRRHRSRSHERSTRSHRSHRRSRSRSPRRERSRTHRRSRSRSPSRRRKSRSRSPVRRRSRSPSRRQRSRSKSRSSVRRKSKSPSRRRSSKSPSRRRSRSRSPARRKRSRSRSKERRHRSKSHERLERSHSKVYEPRSTYPDSRSHATSPPRESQSNKTSPAFSHSPEQKSTSRSPTDNPSPDSKSRSPPFDNRNESDDMRQSKSATISLQRTIDVKDESVLGRPSLEISDAYNIEDKSQSAAKDVASLETLSHRSRSRSRSPKKSQKKRKKGHKKSRHREKTNSKSKVKLQHLDSRYQDDDIHSSNSDETSEIWVEKAVPNATSQTQNSGPIEHSATSAGDIIRPANTMKDHTDNCSISANEQLRPNDLSKGDHKGICSDLLDVPDALSKENTSNPKCDVELRSVDVPIKIDSHICPVLNNGKERKGQINDLDITKQPNKPNEIEEALSIIDQYCKETISKPL